MVTDPEKAGKIIKLERCRVDSPHKVRTVNLLWVTTMHPSPSDPAALIEALQNRRRDIILDLARLDQKIAHVKHRLTRVRKRLAVRSRRGPEAA